MMPADEPPHRVRRALVIPPLTTAAARASALEDLLHFLAGAVEDRWVGPFITECIAKIDEGKPWRSSPPPEDPR